MPPKTTRQKTSKGPQSEVHFILVRPRNPLNIGAAARAVANFGFSSLRVVDPYEPVWRETKSAVGAEPLIENAKKFNGLSSAIADCRTVIGTTALKNRTVSLPAASAAKSWPYKRLKGPWAILFGSEKAGLKNEDLSECHALLHIPTDSGCLSMNLAQAVAVASFWARHLSGWEKSEWKNRTGRDPLKGNEAQRLIEACVEAIDEARVFPQWSKAASVKKVTEAIKRMKPSAPDAALLHGLFRTLRKKQKPPKW